MQTLFTTMLAVCFVAVPYVCLRLGAARRSWVLAAALILTAAAVMPAGMLLSSHARWREARREFFAQRSPVRVAGEEGSALPVVVRDGVQEVTLPDGRVLRLSPPLWEPWRDLRADQCLVLAGAAAGFGAAGYAAGRTLRRAASRPAV